MLTMLTDILAVEPEEFLFIILNWLVFKDDTPINCINPVFLRCQHWFASLQLTCKFMHTILLSNTFIKFHFMLSRPCLYPTIQSIDDSSRRNDEEYSNVTEDGTYICSMNNCSEFCSDFKTDSFSFNATVPDLNNNGSLKHISHDVVELNLPLGQPVTMSHWLNEPWNEYIYDYVHKFSTKEGPKEHDGPLKCTSRYFPNCTHFILLVFRTDETLPYSVNESSFYSFAYCLFPCKPNGMIPAYTGVYDIVREISENEMVMVNYIQVTTTSDKMEQCSQCHLGMGHKNIHDPVPLNYLKITTTTTNKIDCPFDIENRACFNPNCFTMPYINVWCLFQMLPCSGTHLCPCAGCLSLSVNDNDTSTDDEMADSE